jgi:hypothetical protein
VTLSRHYAGRLNSLVVNANDTTPPTPGDQPQMTEEQVREYLEQVRDVPAEQVVSDVIAVVLNAASAKIGRNDGRLLIDVAAVVLEHTRPHLSGEFATQVDQALGQLRMGQVQAEGEAKEEPNDIAAAPATPAPASPAQPSPAPAPEQPAAAKLWIPGRD